MISRYDNIKKIKIGDYTYDLPENRIAKYPLETRDSSKLLVYKDGNIFNKNFTAISKYIPDNYLLVVNDTKVIQARIVFHKNTGARIEIFCLEPHEPADFAINFQQNISCSWKCIIGNNKKWKDGLLVKKFSYKNSEYTLTAEKIKDNVSHQIIQFHWDCEELSFSDVLDLVGETPIPPYLNRDAEELDKNRYQTLYSAYNGSVAAPTAGLHFTEGVLGNLMEKGIEKVSVTLHVGAGTFKPVKSEYITDHEMHTEHFFVHQKTLLKIIENIDAIIAVGTTSVRTLESLYWLGVKILQHDYDMHISQWYPYSVQEQISEKDAYLALAEYMKKHNLQTLQGSTQLMIVPGYTFNVAKGMITNFHQPNSTLLLLISAFIGDAWKKVYKEALENDFRFLSYGDSSLLIP